MMTMSKQRRRPRWPIWLALVLATICGCATSIAHAAPGGLDPQFGSQGKAFFQAAGLTLTARAVLLQPDGKILAGGNATDGTGATRWIIVRFLQDGVLDTGFGNAGTVFVDFGPGAKTRLDSLTLLADGRIRVAGLKCGPFYSCARDFLAGPTAQVTLVGLTAAGAIDQTFANAGIYEEDGTYSVVPVRTATVPSAAPASAERTIILYEEGGYSARSSGDPFVSEVSPSGVRNNNFPSIGNYRLEIGDGQNTTNALLGFPSGGVLVGGYPHSALIRLTAPGEIDTTFGKSGAVQLSTSNGPERILSAVFTPDNHLLALTSPGLELARLSVDGVPDPTFAPGGIQPLDGFGFAPMSAIADEAGCTLLLGRSASAIGPELILARLDSEFGLDLGFGVDGQVKLGIAPPSELADQITRPIRQPDGKLLVLGTADGKFALARILPGDDLPVVRYAIGSGRCRAVIDPGTGVPIGPVLIAPGASLTAPIPVEDEAKPTYIWNGVARAKAYTLLIGKIVDGGFVGLLYASYSPAQAGCAEDTRFCSIRPDLPFTSGDTVHWAVFASNESGAGPLSPSRRFVVGDTTVEAPGRVSLEGVGSLLVSDPLVVNTATPTFTWNATAGATSYTLLVGKIVNGVFIGLWYAPYDAVLVGCANGTGICSKASPLPLASGDTIEWAVFASNAAGVGDVSPSLHFVVGPTTPGVPSTGVVTLVGPGVYNTKILAPINTARPTYSWNAIAGATTYTLIIFYRNHGLHNGSSWEGIWYAVYPAGLAGCADGSGVCSITPPLTLEENKQVEWAIRPSSAAGDGPLTTNFWFLVGTTGP